MAQAEIALKLKVIPMGIVVSGNIGALFRLRWKDPKFRGRIRHARMAKGKHGMRRPR